MKTRIVKIKGDWQEVLDKCRFTRGKAPLGREPSGAFKKAVLLAEHSPIRSIEISWQWMQLPHWVGVHWLRHIWQCLVRSQRTERTGLPREALSQAEPQDFWGEANVQHLIDTMRKRLCFQASPETRACAESLKRELAKVQPEIAGVLVPNCIYRCGCPEMAPCPYNREKAGFFRWAVSRNPQCGAVEIQARYEAYQDLFEGEKAE